MVFKAYSKTKSSNFYLLEKTRMNFWTLISDFARKYPRKIAFGLFISISANILILPLPIYIAQSFDLLFNIRSHRAQILLQSGYSIDEIAAAVLQVEYVQKQRAESLNTTGLGERVQLLIETTGKLPLGLVKGILRKSKPKPKTLQARSA